MSNVRVYICDTCGARSEDQPSGAYFANPPHGWASFTVGREPRHHACPDCLQKIVDALKPDREKEW